MPGNPSPSNGASDCFTKALYPRPTKKTQYVHKAPQQPRATTHDQPQRAAKKSDSARDTRGEEEGGEESAAATKSNRARNNHRAAHDSQLTQRQLRK